jgi:predicted glycoside hydrolase/deacetylase ChbG (UPF0249 family)
MLTRPKLIISADDFGFSPAVNEAVLAGASAGILTAASVMVNMPFAEEACRQTQERCPRLSIGLHVTLTSGKPLTDPLEIPMLTDSHGMFCRNFLQLWNMLRSKNRNRFLKQIETELSSQMNVMEQFVTKYDLCFDHLDSHQHIHVLPGIWEWLSSEAEKRKLHLRVPRERVMSWQRGIYRFPVWLFQGLIKRAILNWCLRNVPQQIGYFGILESGKMDASAICAIIQSLDSVHDTYEINVHPSLLSETKNSAVCCSSADRNFHLSPWRYKEFLVLQDDQVLQCIKKYGILVRSFSRK